MLTAHLDGLGIGAPVNGDAIYNGALDNAAGVAALLDIAEQFRRQRRAAAPLDPVRRSSPARKRACSARAGSRGAPTVPRASIVANLNYDMALPLFPLTQRHRAGRGGKQPRRRRPRGRRGDGPAGGSRSRSRSATPSSAPTNIRSSRRAFRRSPSSSASRAGTPGGRDRARLAREHLSQPAATMRRRPCSARTRSGCTISSPRSRCGSPMPTRGRAGTTTASSAASRRIEDDEERCAARWRSCSPAAAAAGARRLCCRQRRARRSAAEVSGLGGAADGARAFATTTGCAARTAFAPPPRRSATGCATMASTRSRSSRCPPTARSSTAPSARGPAGTRASPSLWEQGDGDGGSPPGPSSRSASRRTASRGRAEAELVDIGAGTSESDYQGKEVRGRLVLTSSQPEAVQELADRPLRRGRHRLLGAEPAHRLVGRGREPGPLGPSRHLLASTRPSPSWSRRRGRGPGRSGCGAARRCGCAPRSTPGRRPSAYLIPTAIIPGRRRDQEIVFSCHLDHPNPGRQRQCLGLRRHPRGRAHPQPADRERRAAAAGADDPLHLAGRDRGHDRPAQRPARIRPADAGDDPSRHDRRRHRDHQVDPARRGSPPSLPSFVSDVGFAFARYVNEQSLAFAEHRRARTCRWSIPTASRRALQAEIGGFAEGSDHQVWAEGSCRIPVIYIADWPDRYIHTQRDVPDNLDPTKMRRAIFIAAASGYYLATHALPSSRRRRRRARRHAVRAGLSPHPPRGADERLRL